MTPGIRSPAVVDTGVFAARLMPSGNLLAARYRPILAGRPVVISLSAARPLSLPIRAIGSLSTTCHRVGPSDGRYCGGPFAQRGGDPGRGPGPAARPELAFQPQDRVRANSGAAPACRSTRPRAVIR